jgi:hypothetical protein
LRSLAAFRILLGFFLFLDVVNKSLLIPSFYAEDGVFPRILWMSQFMNSAKYSFHLMSGDTKVLAFLFVVQALLALAFMVGYRTKTVGVILYVFICSLQARNSFILASSDDLMRLALFWSLFLPISKKFSLEQEDSPSDIYVSWTTLPFIFQLFTMYMSSAIYKLSPTWMDGYAVYYSLNLEMYTKPMAHWFKDSLIFSKLVTHSTHALEFFGPVTFMLVKRSRLLVVAAFLSFHFGLYLCLELGFFPWIAMVYWVALIPSVAWEHSLGKKAAQFLSSLFEKYSFKNLVSAEPTRVFKYALHGFLFACFFMQIVVVSACFKTVEQMTPNSLYVVSDFIGLNQQWDMFAPTPVRNDGWFVIEATTSSGKTFDYMTGLAPQYAKPELPSAQYWNSEWRKFYLKVWDMGNERILSPFSKYLCRQEIATDAGAEKIESLKIYFNKKRTPEPELMSSPAPIEKIHLWTRNCITNFETDKQDSN